MAEGCIFCGIVAGEIPGQVVRQDEHTVAFRDIGPVAPTHVLVVPRRHIASMDEVTAADAELVGRLFVAARAVAEQEGLDDGYRLVVNNGRGAGQSVDHVHLHVLGGRSFDWPPG